MWHFVKDRMPTLATAQAGNDLDTLTLFCGTQTGGPALSPVEQRIWILHEWLRHSILHPASHSLLIEPHKAHHVARSTKVQIVPLGWYWTGGGRWSPNPSPTGARWREHRLPTPRLRAHSGRWIGWPTHQRRQSMPLRACASLGCSYAKFDERGFSGSDELGLRCEIRFLVKTLQGLRVALFLHCRCTSW